MVFCHLHVGLHIRCGTQFSISHDLRGIVREIRIKSTNCVDISMLAIPNRELL